MQIEEQIRSAVLLCAAVGELIQEVHEVPSGHLYAILSAQAGFTLDHYQRVISMLKQAGFVREENFLLTWTGPDNGPLFDRVSKAMGYTLTERPLEPEPSPAQMTEVIDEILPSSTTDLSWVRPLGAADYKD